MKRYLTDWMLFLRPATAMGRANCQHDEFQLLEAV